MVKNSWGLSGKYKGIWYASKAFVAYKTMNILVHKDALPKDIAKNWVLNNVFPKPEQKKKNALVVITHH